MDISTMSADTTKQAQAVQLEIYRKMDGKTKLKMAFQLSDELWRIIEDGIRFRHPDYDEQTIRYARMKITLGEKLFHEAFPDVKVEV